MIAIIPYSSAEIPDALALFSTNYPINAESQTITVQTWNSCRVK